MAEKKRFFTSHSKSSAAVISLAVHALLVVLALSFVAVTVITKDEVTFDSKPPKRPKMPLKKLQVPVDVKKATKKPKLRQNIVVKVKQTVPDFKMPEIVGVKGGIGAGAGTGMGGSLGFSMPDINLFGVKGKGEKIFIILDSTPEIMEDRLGGIPAYTLIKQELVRVLGQLNSTVLFNVAVYERGPSKVLFPTMVPATDANVAKVQEWLEPLNAVSTTMGARDYGIKTLGRVQESRRIEGDFKIGKLQTQREWIPPIMLSMQQKADTVFLLSNRWGTLWHDVEDAASWPEAKWERWRQAIKDSNEKLAAENKVRIPKGLGPRVFRDQRAMVRHYYPNVEQPPASKKYLYTAKDLAEAIELTREQQKADIPKTLGLDKKKKDRFTINIVHFVKKSGADQRDKERFMQLANEFDGEYRTLAGFDAIKSAIPPDEPAGP